MNVKSASFSRTSGLITRTLYFSRKPIVRRRSSALLPADCEADTGCPAPRRRLAPINGANSGLTQVCHDDFVKPPRRSSYERDALKRLSNRRIIRR